MGLFGGKKISPATFFAGCIFLVIGLTSVVVAYENFNSKQPFNIKNNVATKTDAEKETEEVKTEEITTEATTQPVATVNDATRTDAPENNTPVSYEPVAEPKYKDSSFKVPKTVLPDIKNVKCNSWFDTNKFQYASGVSDEYFDDAVFIGDSRTEGLEIYGGQKNINTFAYKGMGIFKADTNKVIKVKKVKMTVYDAIDKTDYKYYYIAYGINEIGYPSTDQYIEKMNSLIEHILAHNPDAIIYVCSIIPVSKNCDETSDVFKLSAVKKFNDAQYEMCKKRGDVIYLDMGASVSDSEGYLPSESTKDGKHPKADYYKRVMAYIRLHIVEKK